MGRIVALAVAVALLIAVALVWLAPATLIATRLDHATAGALTFANAEGTVWRARGSLVANGISVPAAWTLDPWSLARGELRVHFTPPSGEPNGPRGEITLGSKTTALRNVDVTVPAAWIAGATASRLPWRPAGSVTLAIAALDWAPPRSAGEARIVWRGAQVSASDFATIDLGTITATISASGDALAGPISNEGGAVAIDGDVAARVGSEIALTATLTPRRADDAALTRLLASLGTPEGDGWRVRWRAAWR